MRYFKKTLLIFLTALLMSYAARAQGEKHYTCYRASGPVVIDGRLSEADWNFAAWSDDFVDITGAAGLKPPYRTQVKLLWDDQYLYVGAWLQEPDVWASIQKRDEVIFHDNDFEVFLDPDGLGLNYYEIEINALGTIWDLMLTKSYNAGGQALSNWDLTGMKSCVQVLGSLNDPNHADSGWVVEMALPVADLMKGKNALSKPREGVQWRLNFSRVEWKTEVKEGRYVKLTDSLSSKPLPEQNWVWSPMGEIAMHIPERWGWLEFSEETIKPQTFRFRDGKQDSAFKVWLWMGGNDQWQPARWDSLFNALHSNGVYGVLIQAGVETLRRIIPLAQKHDIHVEKWFITMMNNDSILIREHPDWFVVNGDGQSSVTHPAYVGYYRFLCPSNPKVLDYLTSQISAYLAIPGLEGIHLDYIRYPDVILPQALWSKYGIVQDREYPAYDYCYCHICRNKYSVISGIDPFTLERPELDTNWRRFRTRQITDVVSHLAESCLSQNKKISAAVFSGPCIAKQLVRQSWDKWPLDEVFPMLYQSFYYGSLDWIRLQTAEGVKSVRSGTALYTGLYLPSLNPRELHTAIQKSIDGGAAGISIFNLESMSADHWKVIKELMMFKTQH